MWEIKLKGVKLPEGYEVKADEDFVYLMNGKRIVSTYAAGMISPIPTLIEEDAFHDYFKRTQKLYERNLQGDE